MNVWCAWCGDEFTPVEYRPASFDDPNYCSDDCEESAAESEERYAAYAEGRYGGAPVF